MAPAVPNDEICAVLSSISDDVVVDAPRIDLESYIQNYSGPTRLDRLSFIGKHSVVLSVEALKAAVVEAKKGRNWEKYRQIQHLLQTLAPLEPEAIYDQEWTDAINKQNKAETIRLEEELKQYKNNLVKESIRLGHQDLGSHLQSIGDLVKAYEAYSRMRQDSTHSGHIVEVSKHLISISMERNDWPAVQSNLQKIQAVPLLPDAEKENQPYIKCTLGLSQLHQGRYNDAASAFLAVDSSMDLASLNIIMSPNDVAVYGGICALATMDRQELQSRVLDNSSFRSYLELEPQLRRAITFFVNSRYSACLSILESYRNDYRIDFHLSPHVAQLFHLIRSKSIVQYFIPFSCVTLDSLNEAFALPGKSIDLELLDMIKSGVLEARIDTQNRLLTAVPKNPRAELQAQTLASAKAYEREMRRRLLRMNVLGADLEVKAPRKAQGAQGILPHINMLPNQGGRRTRAMPEGFENDSGYE